MKSAALCLSLLGLALGGHAQQPPEANAPSAKLDASKSPVASPNRTSSRTWATSGKGDKSRHQVEKREKGDRADSAAIKWVDSSGRTMGRAIGNFAILATFDNQLATITGLEADQICDANRVCTYQSGGARWSEFQGVYYTTPDCTGTP